MKYMKYYYFQKHMEKHQEEGETVFKETDVGTMKHQDDFQCQQCDKKFSFPSELKRHIDSVHKGIKNFQCDKCDAKYDRASSLKEHIKYIHMGHARAKNQCDKCGKAFGTPGYLEKHTLTVHEGLVQKVTCEHCGKNFTSNAYCK